MFFADPINSDRFNRFYGALQKEWLIWAPTVGLSEALPNATLDDVKKWWWSENEAHYQQGGTDPAPIPAKRNRWLKHLAFATTAGAMLGIIALAFIQGGGWNSGTHGQPPPAPSAQTPTPPEPQRVAATPAQSPQPTPPPVAAAPTPPSAPANASPPAVQLPAEIWMTCDNTSLPKNCRLPDNAPQSLTGCAQDGPRYPWSPLHIWCPRNATNRPNAEYVTTYNAEKAPPGANVQIRLVLKPPATDG
jgi:hypothetical protein